MKKINGSLVYLVVLLTGLGLRWYHPSFYPFGFDQVQVLENAQAIKEGNVRLIGPMTGPAQMFTGPLIYYICALALLVIHSPYALVLTSLAIYLLTALTLLLLIKRYLPEKQGLLVYILWALSPFVVKLDRITWNPNLTLLSAFLVFFPLLKIVKDKRASLVDTMLLCLGAFLSYQAHFSGLMLPVFISLAWLIRVKKQIGYLLFALNGIVLSILPAAIFDLRHDFLNSKGLLTFLLNNQKDGGYSILYIFVRNVLVTFENGGRLLFEGNARSLLILVGAVLLVGIVYIIRLQKHTKLVFSVVWVFGVALLISIYKQLSPEYYFLVQLPAFVYLLAFVLSKTEKKIQYVFLCVWVMLSIWTSIEKYNTSDQLTIGSQLRVKDHIEQRSQDYPVKQLVYDMPYAANDGLTYLLKDFKTNSSGSVVHVVFPAGGNVLKDYVAGPLAVWYDARSADKNYVELPFIIIESPKTVLLFQNHYISTQEKTNLSFEVFSGAEHIGTVSAFNRKLHNTAFLDWTKTIDAFLVNSLSKTKNGEWVQISAFPNTWIYRQDDQNVLVYTPKLSEKLDFKQIQILKSAL